MYCIYICVLIYGYVHWFVTFVDASGKNCLVFPQEIQYPGPGLRSRDWSQVENREKGAWSGNILREVAKLLKSSSLRVVSGEYKRISTMQAGYLTSRG